MNFDTIIKLIPALGDLMETVNANMNREDGDLRYMVVPEEPIASYMRRGLPDVSELVVRLGDGTVEVSGVAQKPLGLRVPFRIKLGDIRYFPADPVGVISFEVDQVHANLDGSFIPRILASVLSAVFGQVFGVDFVLGKLADMDAVHVKGNRCHCDLMQVEQIRTKLEHKVLGQPVGQFFRLTDVKIVPGEVRIWAVPSEKGRALGRGVEQVMNLGRRLLGRMRRRDLGVKSGEVINDAPSLVDGKPPTKT